MLYMKGNPSQPMCEWIMMLRFMLKTILQEDLIISYLSLFLCNRRWIFLSGR
jgi:glutaredoxin-related protein